MFWPAHLLLALTLKTHSWSLQTPVLLSYTHPWYSFQALPEQCFLLFIFCHLSIRKCFANSAQLTASSLLNPSSNSLSPDHSQCKQSNTQLFATASQDIMSHCENNPTLLPGACSQVRQDGPAHWGSEEEKATAHSCPAHPILHPCAHLEAAVPHSLSPVLLGTVSSWPCLSLDC